MNKNTCKTCVQEKNISEFYKSTRTTSGYRNTCKACCANQAASRYEKTKEFVGHNKANLPLPSIEWLHDNFDYHCDGYFIRKITRGRSSAGNNEPKFIDHKDKIRTNCRVENLREASKNENARNQVLPSNNTSGFYCVRWSDIHNKWTVYISYDGLKTGASFHCVKKAVEWYCKRAEELHGEFAKDKIAHNKKALKEYLSR